MLRAGVVGALVVGAALTFPPAALAAPNVDVNPNSVTLAAGGDATVTVRITVPPGEEDVTVSLTGLPGGVSCSDGCGETEVQPGQAKNHLLTLKASDSAQAANGRTVTVRVQSDADATTKNFSLTVTPKQQEQPPEQSVKRVSGKVKDTVTGDGIEGALVALLDTQGHNCTTNTSSNGNYQFSSCEGKPIAVGELLIGVSHEDYEEPDTKKVAGTAGGTITVGTFALKSTKVAATPSAQASVPPSEEAAPEAETSADASPLAAENASSEESGMGSWLLIIVGGLLVALGVGAIVLLVVRRKQDPTDPGMDDDEPVRPGGRTPVPGAAGVYHPANDATRIAGGGPGMAGRPSIADAPTMLHSPVPADEFPDPYGAPLPPQSPSYSGQGGAYGGPAAGATSVYGGAASGPGNNYGAPAGGPNGAGGYGRASGGGAGEYGRPTSGAAYGGPSGPTSGAAYSGPSGPTSGAAYGGPNGPSGGSEYGGPSGPTSSGGYGGPNGAPAGGEYGRPTSGSGYGQAGQGGYDRGGANGYGGPAAPGGYGSPAAPAGPYAGGAGRGADDGYGGGGRDYREQPQGGGYGGQGAGGYGGGSERYDEPTGRWEGNGATPGGGYGQPQPQPQPQPPAYESGPYGGGGGGGSYRSAPEPDRGDYGPAGGYDQGGYGPANGEYGRPAGGGGGAAGYSPQGGGGYGGNGYDQQAGYDPRGGYDQVPQQRGGAGHDPRGGYEQDGYYDEQAGPRAGRGGPQQPAGRSERRSLDWLDD